MGTANQVYKNPKPGQPLISVICSAWKTPTLKVKFSNLVNPYYYKNSPKIPRYSITCTMDPAVNSDFIKTLKNIEKKEGVDTILKFDTVKEKGDYINTGLVIIKFQTKDIIPVYLGEKGKPFPEKPTQIELQDELGEGEEVVVVYDILRYTKKNTAAPEHGLSFKASCIYFYPKEE